MKRLITLLAFLRIIRLRCPHHPVTRASAKQWQCSRAVHSTGEHRWSLHRGRWIFMRLHPLGADCIAGLVIALLVAACAVVPWLWLADAAGGGR